MEKPTTTNCAAGNARGIILPTAERCTQVPSRRILTTSLSADGWDASRRGWHCDDFLPAPYDKQTTPVLCRDNACDVMTTSYFLTRVVLVRYLATVYFVAFSVAYFQVLLTVACRPCVFCGVRLRSPSFSRFLSSELCWLTGRFGQNDGLLGSRGLLPASQWMQSAKQSVIGGDPELPDSWAEQWRLFQRVPTLFWFTGGCLKAPFVACYGVALDCGQPTVDTF